MKKIFVSFVAAILLTVFTAVGSSAFALNSMFLELKAGDSASAEVAQKIEKMHGVHSVFYNPENGVVSILYMDDLNPQTIKNQASVMGFKTDTDVTAK